MVSLANTNSYHHGKCEENYFFRPDGLMLTCRFSKNHPWGGEIHTYSYWQEDLDKYDEASSSRPIAAGVYVSYEKNHPKHGICRYYDGHRSQNNILHVTVEFD